MPAAALVRGADRLYLVNSGGPPREIARLPPGPSGLVDSEPALPESLLAEVRRASASEPLICDDPVLARRLARAGLRLSAGEPLALRAARDQIPRPSVAELRRILIPFARESLGRTLARPEEALIALAREEERLERAAHRERAAQEELLVGESAPLTRYAESGTRLRSDLDRHLRALHDELDRLCAEVAPNLRELLGASLTSRLVAAAGGLQRLGTISGARLQLIGTRRRPSATRGPRYGFIYRAPRMGELPPGRRAAYARSLAALAVIAARADAFTHRLISPELVARRDRRVSHFLRAA